MNINSQNAYIFSENIAMVVLNNKTCKVKPWKGLTLPKKNKRFVALALNGYL